MIHTSHNTTQTIAHLMFIHQNACRKYVIIPNWIFLISGMYKKKKKVENAKETHRERCASWVWSVYNKRHVICVPLQFRGYSLQTSTPKEKQPTPGCGSHLPALSPLLSLWQGRSPWSSVFCMCVCETEREKKGQEEEKLGRRRDITDSPPDHLFKFRSLWTALR